MSQIITATFEDGSSSPTINRGLLRGQRSGWLWMSAREEPLDDPSAELDRLCEEFPIDTGGIRLTRDQLHERR